MPLIVDLSDDLVKLLGGLVNAVEQSDPKQKEHGQDQNDRCFLQLFRTTSPAAFEFRLEHLDQVLIPLVRAARLP